MPAAAVKAGIETSGKDVYSFLRDVITQKSKCKSDGEFNSSLSCRADKTSSAVQLFDIYRQYNDDELQTAIKKLHVEKVITISRKAGNAMFKSGKVLPLSFAPYKFSFAFQHLLNMKYAHTIYSESFFQIGKLLENGDGEEFEINLNECNVTLFLLASKGLVSFRAVVPDQIIILDSGNLSDASYSKMLQRYREMLRFSGSTSKIVCSSGKIIMRSEEASEKGGESKKRSLSEAEDQGFPAKKTKLEALNDGEELEEEEKASDDGMESVKAETACEGRDKDQSSTEKMTRSSRVILYMMREEAKKEANKDSGKVGQEFCVVNASKVLGKVDKNGLERYSKEMEPKMAGAITKRIISRSLVPLTLVDEDSAVAKDESNETRKTLDFISSKKEFGATIDELNSNFGNLGNRLGEILNRLIESKILIKSGIDETRFVSQKHSTPWLLNSFKMTRLEREKLKPAEVAAVALDNRLPESEEVPKKKIKGVIGLEEMKSDSYLPPSCSTDVSNKIKLILRPWIRIDGSLNRKVLDRFLGTVLGFVMMRPGISVKSVTNKFSPFLSPTWTKDLVEILFEIGCVTLTSLTVLEKSSLFSKSVVRVSDVTPAFMLVLLLVLLHCRWKPKKKRLARDVYIFSKRLSIAQKEMKMAKQGKKMLRQSLAELKHSYTGLEDDEFVSVEAKVDAITTLGLFIGKKNYSKDFLVK